MNNFRQAKKPRSTNMNNSCDHVRTKKTLWTEEPKCDQAKIKINFRINRASS